MTIVQIAAVAAATVGIVDQDMLTVAEGFTRIRHQQIYESYDWTAAQDIISEAVTAQNYFIELPNAERVISARWASASGVTNFLDPVSESYLFESLPELIQELGRSQGTPKYYIARYLPETQNMAVAITPIPDADGSAIFLIKRKFDGSATEPLIPNIDETLVAFVVSDLWEFLRQVGKATAKRQEATALLQAVQQRDTPAPPKPRTSKILTASGSTLSELADSVCQITGQWTPDYRESVKERIRRNYQLLYDMYMLPESIIIGNVPLQPGQQQVVLPHLFDRVVAVRTNKGGPLTQVTPVENREIQYFFGTTYDIFEQNGEPVFYTMLPTLGTSSLPPFREPVQVASLANSQGGPLMRHPHPGANPDTGVEVFIKGESGGAEVNERVAIVDGATPGPGPTPIDAGWATSVYSYDTPLVITKPDTKGIIQVRGAISKLMLLEIGPEEHERKHLRIWLLPNLGSAGNVDVPGSVLVCGKRKMSPLIDEGDSPQLRNVSNILINATASDMLQVSNPDLSAKLAQQAAAQTQALITAETAQNAYTPRIVPFTENYNRRGYLTTIP